MEKAEIKEYCIGMFDYKPTGYQLDFMYDCINHKKVVAVFARQSGKSETTSKVAIMFARFITSAPILIFAPTDRQAGLIALKIETSLKKMLKLSHFQVVRQTQREFYFNNGGSIICMTTGDRGETILGHTAGAIILDEAGSIKDIIYQSAILPMGNTTNAPIIKIGTPKGKNHFFESSVNSNFKLHQVDYTKALAEGIHTEDFVEEVKRSVDSITWRTEMLAEFVEDSDAYFGYDLIESCIDRELGEGKKKEGYTYYMGCDIARLGKDRTVFMIMKQGKEGEPSELVKIVTIDKSKLDFVVDEIMRLNDAWGFDKIFIDETGLGAGVVDFCARKFNSQNLLKDKQTGFNRNYKYNDKIVGVKFTIQSKLDIYSHLKNFMEQGIIKIPNDRDLVAQLRDFRYELTESNVKLHHSDGGYDDYCDALALAARGLKENGGGVVIDW